MKPPKHLLVAEDDLSLAELLRRSIAPYLPGSAVTHAVDGVEALDYLFARGQFQGRETGDPTLVLLDLSMPRMGGLETLQEIRSNPDFRHLPVVMMTSAMSERNLADCYEAGASAFIVKPVEAREFRRAMEETIQFWMNRNEAPPGLVQNSSAAFAGGGLPFHDRNEKISSHPKLGR